MITVNAQLRVGVLLLTSFLAPHALAQSSEAEFYKGKQIRMVIGISPGGGFDAFARLVARHLGRNIPGEPSIIPQNLPGASGLTAVQVLAGNTDGTSIVHFNPGLILQAVTSPETVKFDFREVAFLGSVSADMRVCYVWHATGIRDWNDLVNRPVVNFGASSRGSGAYVDAAVLRNVMDVKVRPVIGYPGTSERLIAIERGELDGDCGSFETIPTTWISEGKIRITHKNTRSQIPGVNVPYLADLTPDAEKKQILSVALSGAEIFRPFIVNAAVPASRLKTLRQALWTTVHDAEFLEDAKLSRRTIEGPIGGEEVQKIIADLYATRPDLLTKAAAAIK
jgi:tripartite-type tricarboxylate transporter receptor subunit TctC